MTMRKADSLREICMSMAVIIEFQLCVETSGTSVHGAGDCLSDDPDGQHFTGGVVMGSHRFHTTSRGTVLVADGNGAGLRAMPRNGD